MIPGNQPGQGIGKPGIQTLSGMGGFLRDPLMQFRGNTHVESPGVGPLRLLSLLRAEIKIVFNRISQRRLQLVNGAPLKGNDILNMKHLAMKNIGFGIILEASRIPLV